MPTIQEATLSALIAQAAEYKASKNKLIAETANLRLDGRELERREKVFDSRTLVFSGDVSEYEVNNAVEQLWDFRVVSKAPVTLLLNSPGGNVFDGLLLFDTFQEMRSEGIYVTVKVKGLAASMGSVLAQAGDLRIVSANSWYMIHEPSTLTWGKVGDIKREAKLLEELHKQLCAVLAERSTMSAAQVISKSRDKDWWVPAKEAHRLGFFDEVA